MIIKKTAFKSLWENHLKGLLFEYLRGMPDAENKLDELKNAYYLNDDNTKQTSDVEKVIDAE